MRKNYVTYIKFQDKKYIRNEVFKDGNRRSQTLSYGATCEIRVVVIKNENTLFTAY